MVVILGTRVETRAEKNKKLKKQKRRSFCKILIIILTLILFINGLKLVNEYIIYLGYIENPTIFNLDIKERELVLFGERYLIDLKILKKTN